MKQPRWKILLAILGTLGLFIPVETPPKQEKDFLLIFLQCVLGLLAFIVPAILCRRWSLEVPAGIYFSYYFFLYGAIFLGEVRSFYYGVPNWDTYLHLFSGMLLGVVGFSVLHLLYREARTQITVPPALAAVFAFCFSVALGAVWEIYEYVADGLMGINMQKFATAEGIALSGRAALADTMTDVIVDTLGALAVAVAGYFSLKHKKGWVEKLLVEKM